MPSAGVSDDAREAISLGDAAIAQETEAGGYLLVASEWLLGGTDDAPGFRCWRLTYKQARLIPSPESPRAGAGGEIAVIVDLDTGETKLRHGE